MKRLHISEDLWLPIDFTTQTQAILAIRRVGKSYTASVEAEELLKAGQQVVAIDITGAWWGLRSSADGKEAGFPVTIFGGDHADLPLEESAGDTLARAIASDRFSAILDLSNFKKAAALRFLASFLETLYLVNRDAMHLFCDEADFYAPQKPFGEEMKTLGAMNDIVLRGGIKGIGCTLITQRPQRLNKDVLTQCAMLTCLRMSHPRDIGAVVEWAEVHAKTAMLADMKSTLPTLPKGNAWIWSAGWPDEAGIFKRVQIRKRTTFNSGATPEAGKIVRAPKVMAKVDLAKLGQMIAATVEKQKANDPIELKAKVKKLERELETLRTAAPAKELKIESESVKGKARIEKAVRVAIKKRDVEWDKKLKRLLKDVDETVDKCSKAFDLAISGIQFEAPAPVEEIETEFEVHSVRTPNGRVAVPDFVKEAVDDNTAFGGVIKDRRGFERAVRHNIEVTTRSLLRNREGESSLPAGEKKVLRAIAQYPQGADRVQLTILTGYKQTSRNEYIKRLAAKGLIEQEGESIFATDAGIAALGSDFEPLPTGEKLQRHLLQTLPKGEAAILEILIQARGGAVTRDAIGEQVGYKQTSRNEYLKRLIARRVVQEAGRGEVRAAKELF